eukprot:366415-Chlamydomonas_euryale.AAC.16
MSRCVCLGFSRTTYTVPAARLVQVNAHALRKYLNACVAPTERSMCLFTCRGLESLGLTVSPVVVTDWTLPVRLILAYLPTCGCFTQRSYSV